MSEYGPSDIRVSDAEREDALAKLGEHMSEGRLDLDEYGERTAQVATAKTRGQLLALFGDLPEPKPTFGQPVPVSADAPAYRSARSVGQRIAPVLIPIAGVLAIVALTALLRFPFFLLFPFLFVAFSGSWGRRGGDAGRRRG